MPTHSQAERHALADALIAAGPDAPTLCEGWTTRDLAAHVVVREARPDLMVGLIAAPDSFLAKRLAKAQDGYAAGDYTALVERFRSGPPLLSVFTIPGLDANGNLGEYFVHTEDVRRAQPGWEARDLPKDRQDKLWSAVAGMGRMMLRKSPVSVHLRTHDGRERTIASRATGAPTVTLTGEPAEIALFLFGRQAHTRLQADGDPAAVTQLNTLKLGL